MLASNFAFLGVHDIPLARLGMQAEQYLHGDPCTAIIKLRQLAELLSKTIAAHHAVYLGERERLRNLPGRNSWN